MTDKKYLPRFWLGHGYADEFGKYDWEFSEKETPSHNEEYCSMVEHAAIVADLERRLRLAADALKKVNYYLDGSAVACSALEEIGEG